MSKSEAGKLGWKALVRNQFDNDELAAKAWLAQLGRWAYSKQAMAASSPLTMQIRSEMCFKHPGAIEDFVSQWNQAMDFQLADIPEMPF